MNLFSRPNKVLLIYCFCNNSKMKRNLDFKEIANIFCLQIWISNKTLSLILECHFPPLILFVYQRVFERIRTQNWIGIQMENFGKVLLFHLIKPSKSFKLHTTKHTSNHYYLINITFKNLEFWDVTLSESGLIIASS